MKSGHGIRKTVFWASCHGKWIALEGIAVRIGEIPVVVHRPLHTVLHHPLNGHGFVVSDPLSGGSIVHHAFFTPESALEAADDVLRREGLDGLHRAQEKMRQLALVNSGPKPTEAPVAGLVVEGG